MKVKAYLSRTGHYDRIYPSTKSIEVDTSELKCIPNWQGLITLYQYSKYTPYLWDDAIVWIEGEIDEINETD